MRITNQNVTSIRNVDSIWEARDLLTSDATLELTSFAEHSNAMPLEVANIEIVS